MKTNIEIMEPSKPLDLFNRINEEKRQRIIDTTIKEFATYGFQNANVNRIAADCQISIGSLYKYFNTKESLFLYIIEYSQNKLEEMINDIYIMDISLFEKLEKLLYLAINFSKQEPELIKLYNIYTSEGNTELALNISDKIEAISSSAYTRLIQQAQKKGEIRKDIDPSLLAMLIDNQLMMMQFSYACAYYEERRKTFLNKSKLKSDKQIVTSIVNFFKAAIEIK